MQTGLLCIQNSIALLEIMRAGIATFDQQIAEIYRNHPDRAIMESFPGAGAALEPRLIAAVGSVRDRFDTANSMACFAGIAPVKESSGKAAWIHWRWACPKFIRQTFYEWARCSIPTCDWAIESPTVWTFKVAILLLFQALAACQLWLRTNERWPTRVPEDLGVQARPSRTPAMPHGPRRNGPG